MSLGVSCWIACACCCIPRRIVSPRKAENIFFIVCTIQCEDLILPKPQSFPSMVGKQLSSPARAFGVVLRRQRRARHLSQEALALEAGLQRNYVSLIELGRNQPTISTLLFKYRLTPAKVHIRRVTLLRLS